MVCGRLVVGFLVVVYGRCVVVGFLVVVSGRAVVVSSGSGSANNIWIHSKFVC